MGIALQLVDGIFDYFDASSNNRENDNNPTAPSNKQVPLAWRMLASLRCKIDLPLGMERPIYEPIAPVRCYIVSPDVALQTKSLAASEKSTSSPAATISTHGASTHGASTHGATPASITSLNSSQSNKGRVPPGQQQNGEEASDTNNSLDMSDLDMWCASLLQDPGALLQDPGLSPLS